MKIIKFEKIKDGAYLKNYEITYLNKSGREKKYEIVSRKDLADEAELGQQESGVSLVVMREGRLLLLHEFRMGINKYIYNLCAGMLEQGEALTDCIARELYEETGLKVKNILSILPPSYAAVAISDVKTSLAFVEAEGEIGSHTSPNESIEAAFYTREEVKKLLEENEFSSRAQIIAYFFAETGTIPGYCSSNS